MYVFVKIMRLIYIIPFVLLTIPDLSAEIPEKSRYIETIDVHFGRNTYISGELFWYKLYCQSNRPDPNEFLSKVAYVELVDENNQQIIGQVLEIFQNSASSVFQIPDTISSGLYQIKAYTQWMRNSGPDSYFKAPVFVYNQYDENAAFALNRYTLQIEPEFFIEGGILLGGVTNRIIVKIPGLFGKQISGSLHEINNDTIIQDFTTDHNGLALLSFIPQLNKTYNLIIGDSFSGKKTVGFPAAEYAGYCIRVSSFHNNMLRLFIEKNNMPDVPVRLEIISDGKTITQLNLTKESYGNEFAVTLPQFDNPYLELRLIQTNGNFLAKQVISTGESRVVKLKSLQEQYAPRTKVKLEISTTGYLKSNVSDLSASIYKTQQPDSLVFMSAEISAEGNVAYLNSGNVITFFQKLSGGSPQSVGYQRASSSGLLPVEDLGILLTGRVLRSQDRLPEAGVEVNVAVKDTLAEIYSSFTDSDGHFVILLNGTGVKEGYINLKRNGIALTGDYILELDSKFDSENQGRKQSFELTRDQQFVDFIKEEAQRTLIQRAFNNNGSIKTESNRSSLQNNLPFYGKPLITVYPQDYIILPNFEEIARELIPRVRYKQNKSGCEILVIDIENNLKSDQPLVLLDGVPIPNLCDIYSLTSDDIERIEVQSGNHVSGNFLYNGLVAVFTSSKYQSKKHPKDDRVTYQIPGYANNSSIYSIKSREGTTNGSRLPDFRNQLYWNPTITINGESSSVEFTTSDEEGAYVIDMYGYSAEGFPLHFQEAFTVLDQ